MTTISEIKKAAMSKKTRKDPSSFILKYNSAFPNISESIKDLYNDLYNKSINEQDFVIAVTKELLFSPKTKSVKKNKNGGKKVIYQIEKSDRNNEVIFYNYDGEVIESYSNVKNSKSFAINRIYKNNNYYYAIIEESVVGKDKIVVLKEKVTRESSIFQKDRKKPGAFCKTSSKKTSSLSWGVKLKPSKRTYIK